MIPKATDTSNDVHWMKESLRRWQETLARSIKRWNGKKTPGMIMAERNGIRHKIARLKREIWWREKDK